MSTSYVFFFFAAALLLLAAEATAVAPPPRNDVPVSWQPFPNLKAPKVTAIAKFAVKGYNEFYPDKAPLTLVSVDKGEFLDAVGSNYHLYITAADKFGPGKYQTFVFEYPKGKLDLTSFVRMDN